MQYDRQKSPSCFQRVVSVNDIAQTVIIERMTDNYYFLREIRAHWREFAVNGNPVIVEPHIEFINTISNVPLQNKPYPIELIATPGPQSVLNRFDAPCKRSIKLNDPILFRQHICLRVSLVAWYSRPLDIALMIIGYNVER